MFNVNCRALDVKLSIHKIKLQLVSILESLTPHSLSK